MADKSLKEIFIGARAILSDPARWGQGSYWNVEGDCLCILGACGVSAGFEPEELDDSEGRGSQDRKSTRLNSSHTVISYAVFCLKKKKKKKMREPFTRMNLKT